MRIKEHYFIPRYKGGYVCLLSVNKLQAIELIFKGLLERFELQIISSKKRTIWYTQQNPSPNLPIGTWLSLHLKEMGNWKRTRNRNNNNRQPTMFAMFLFRRTCGNGIRGLLSGPNVLDTYEILILKYCIIVCTQCWTLHPSKHLKEACRVRSTRIYTIIIIIISDVWRLAYL